jgi:fatty acid synthase
MGENLFNQLTDVIKSPKKRSAKWLSSTYPSEQWNDEESQYSSAAYHTKNLLSPVLFHEVVQKLPDDVMTIEIAPHGLLKPIVKRALKDGLHFNLTQRSNKNGTFHLMNVLGQ